MAAKSKIEWTDSTWNPVTGCTKVGTGCDNCYAERIAERFRGKEGHPYEQGFDLRLWPERLDQPEKWRKPRVIFVNSMSDLFHKDIPRSFLDEIFLRMEQAPWHEYLVLTKRSSLMAQYAEARYNVFGQAAPPHIWFGATIENAAAAGRIKHLLAINTESRFISFEPLLGPIADINLSGIPWAIVGGESGPKARPMRTEWALEIQRACRANGTKFFFKQWGGLRPKSNGRILAGREWNETPSRILNASFCPF